MKHSITLFVDKTKELLSRASNMATLFDCNFIFFYESYCAWLLDAEKLLKEYNFPEQATIATLRILVSTSDEKAKELISNSTSTRKKKKQILSEYFSDGMQCVYQVYMKEQSKINEAQDIINQVVLVAIQNKKLPIFSLKSGQSLDDISKLYSIIYTDPELQKGINKALNTVSYPDVIRLLDNILEEILYAQDKAIENHK